MTPNELASKPASEATLYEDVSKSVLQASVTCNGRLSNKTHVQHSFQLTDLYFEELARRQGGAK